MRARSPFRTTAILLALVLVTGTLGSPVTAQTAPSAADTLAGLALPAEADLAADAALVPDDVPEPLPAEVDLGRVETILADVFAGLPEADWTVPGLAAAMAFDPTQPFLFVRDRIAFQPYAGVLRGADGALAARAGNSWDRALLLQALLDEMLVPARLAWGDLDPATAAVLLTRGLEAPPVVLSADQVEPVTGLALADVAERARRDHAAVRAALGARVADLGIDASDQALRELTCHAWVQALIGTEWVDLDPSLPDAPVGTALTTALATADAPPAEVRQVVTVRVVVEHLDSSTGALTETVVLDTPLDVADSLDRATTLGFKPSSDQLGATIETLFSGVADWVPVLSNGAESVDGSAFGAGGRGTDVFGTDVEAPELTAIRLELVSSGPDRDPVTAISPILDRVPPDVRAAGSVTPGALLPLPGDDKGAYAVSRVVHLLLSAGGFNAHDQVGDVGAGISYVNDVLLAPELAAKQTLAELVRPLLAVDGQLVAGAETVSVPALRDPGRIGAYVAAPRVYLVTFGPSDIADGSMLRFDLALDDVRVLAGPDVAPTEVALRRLWYGALQSAVETELGLTRARSTDPATLILLGASFASGGPLVVLDAVSAAGRTDLAPALRRTLDAGGLAVAPAGDAAPAVWWEIAPDGLARSVSAPGHGNVSYAGRPAGSDYSGLKQRGPVGGGNGGGAGKSWGNRGGKTVELGASCRPAGEYGALTSCVSVPGGLAFRLALAVAIDAVIFAVIWGAFAAVAAVYGPG